MGFPRESKISRALTAMIVFESGAAAPAKVGCGLSVLPWAARSRTRTCWSRHFRLILYSFCRRFDLIKVTFRYTIDAKHLTRFQGLGINKFDPCGPSIFRT